jgi:L-threonylcarbamoyladenylate synthase
MDSEHLWLEDDPAMAVGQAAAVLSAGGTVVFPTDTVYGILAGLRHQQAYLKIFELKRRPAHKPLAQLVAEDDAWVQAVEEALVVHATARELFRRGELTLILPAELLPKGKTLSAALSIQPGLVGLRVPRHNSLQALIAQLAEPVWATSANSSGTSPISQAAAAAQWAISHYSPPELTVLSREPLLGKPSIIAQLADGQLQHLSR